MIGRIIAAAGCLVALAGASSEPAKRTVVHADGRAGAFRIDVTTEAQLRARLGRPENVIQDVFPRETRPRGHTLEYGCTRHGCATDYSFNNKTRALSDFQSTSARFVTERGSYVGMSAKEAARREHRRLRPDCGRGLYLHIRSDAHHSFVVNTWHARVFAIIYLGPHSVYYDGLC